MSEGEQPYSNDNNPESKLRVLGTTATRCPDVALDLYVLVGRIEAVCPLPSCINLFLSLCVIPTDASYLPHYDRGFER